MQIGINPILAPVFHTCFTDVELEDQLYKYKDVMGIILLFIDRLLSSMADHEVVLFITDNNGYILTIKGNLSFLHKVRSLGITEGVRFSEDTGTNSIDLCLQYERPIAIVGEDHFHRMLKSSACYSVPMYGEDQQMIGTLSLMTEEKHAHPQLLHVLSTITDAVKHEMMLRHENNQLNILNQALLGNQLYGIVITDSSGNILEINEKCIKILDLNTSERSELMNSSVTRISAIGKYFRLMFDEQTACTGIELCLQVQDSQHHYILDVIPVFDDTQTLIRVVGSLQDITEMKKTEEMLRNIEKLIFAGELAVSIAHEIRNPLATVKGLLELSRTDAIHHYDLIMSELNRMDLITRDFMILGKPQATQFNQDYCHTIIQEVLRTFHIQAELNQISIEYDMIQDKKVHCDRNQLKQVFLNILSNAKDALPQGGIIQIALEVQGAFQRVRISDNGVGMSDDVLKKVGEPFYTTKEDGNGLGMTIVHKILASHGGHLNLTSDVGLGTTIDIYIPIEAKDAL
ncbi:ATP-binding protein [Paenibacillus sp. CMAA1364]